jgi:peptide/nickel transport system substrate-binding protein
VALGIGLLPRLSAFTLPDFREALVTPQRPLSLDPLVGADTPAVHDVGHLLYRSLLRLDGSAYPVPDLATQYSTDQTGTTYTFALGKRQRWSDGRPITPADVLATVGFVQSHASADRRMADALTGIRVSRRGGDVVFVLAAPRSSFAATLTQLPILPLGTMSSRQLAALPKTAPTPLATSGPYRVRGWGALAIDLIPNPHALKRPNLGRFELRLYGSFDDAAAAFARGDVDGMLATTPEERAQLLHQSHSRAHDIATFRFVDLMFNERVAGLDDPVVRSSVAAAVDRKALVDGALARAGGLVEADAFSRGIPWISARDQNQQGSLGSAQSALDADGWARAPDGVRARGGVALAYTLVVPNSDPLPRVAEELGQQLDPLGISLTVEVVPARAFLSAEVEPHSFQVALADWSPGPDPDVSSFWRSNASPPSGFNVSGGAADPFLDQALDMLATLSVRSDRVAAAATVAAHLAGDAPAVFLYTPTVSFVTRGALARLSVPTVGDSEARYDAVGSWRRN